MADPVAAATAFWDLKASEVLKFISGLISALAWPIAAVFIVGFFKKPIMERIPGLSELTLPGGFSAKFKDVLAQMEGKVAEQISARGESPVLPSSDQPQGAPAITEPRSVKNPEQPEANSLGATGSKEIPAWITLPETDLIALRTNPTGVVMESWQVIEEALRALAFQRFGFVDPAGRRFGISQLLDFLRAKGALRNTEVENLENLHQLRNMAAHSPSTAISEFDAFRFKRLADSLASAYLKPGA